MRKAFLLAAFTVAVLFGLDPAARRVKTVYLFRMGSSLDQYLASELIRQGVFSVTTDPRRADALLTDSIGEGFETRFVELYGSAKAETKQPKKNEGPEDNQSAEAANVPPVSRAGNTLIGRNKGTIFLVDRNSRTVLWATTRTPSHMGWKETMSEARSIVAELKKELRVSSTNGSGPRG